jgi:TRAP-type C4-dicarboxylate transport system permease small subunit
MSTSPSDSHGIAPGAEQRIGSVLEALCRWTALAGGLVLVALIVLTVVSVSGRALVFAGLGPIQGDFELLEAGTAFATFSFLAWCQIRRGHVTVDILVPVLGPRRDAWLGAVGDLLMTAAAVLITWRLWFGMLDKIRYGETSFILQFPRWWGYAVCIPPLILFAVVSGYTVWRDINDSRRARATPPPDSGI